MNAHCHKVIFSKRLGTLVAVGEHTASTGKAASGQGCRGSVVAHGFVGALRFTCASVALAFLSLGNTQAQSSSISSTALPQGGSVSTGSATISTSGANMAINQSTEKASINWQSFNIGTGASVNIAQPSSSAVLLNRVVGNDPSQILGQLKANGQVILVNPNGIMFGKDGSVTASAFTASTFGLSDADFMNGYYKFSRNGSTASVVNHGSVTVQPGGYVALIGAEVSNDGRIAAPQGAVVLAAAESVTLPAEVTTPQTVKVPLSKRVRLELAPAAVDTAVQNTDNGVIVTEGGQVLMQASALATAVASVTHSGSIDTSGPQAGDVTLLADHGHIKVDGHIKANSSGTDNNGQANAGGRVVIGRNEDTGVLASSTDIRGATLQSQGGFVETSGALLLSDNVNIQADQWLIDPYDIEITDSANALSAGYTTKITTQTLQSALNNGTDVVIQTTASGPATGVGVDTTGTSGGTGNILVTTAILKNADSTSGADPNASLTLKADNNIVLNAGISATSGKLDITLDAGNTTSTGKIDIGGVLTSNGGNINARTRGTGAITQISSVNSGSTGNVVYQTNGGQILLRGASTLSGKNASLDSTGGQIDATTGVITAGSGNTGTATGVYIYNANVNLSGNLYAIGASSSGIGIQVNQSSSGALGPLAQVKAANIYMNGSSDSGIGVLAYNGALVQATAGSVELTSTTATGSHAMSVEDYSQIKATGDITLRAANNDINIANLNGTVTTTGSGATVAVVADNINITGAISATNGTVALQNYTAGTAVALGGSDAAGVLGISAAELGKITASQTVVGSSTAGNVSVSITSSADASGHLGLKSAGNVSLGGNLSVGTTGTKNLSIDATGANSTVSSGGVITAGGLKLSGNNAAVSLSNYTHQINTLTANVKSLNFHNGKALLVGQVDGQTGLQVTDVANLTVAGALTTDASTNATIAGGSLYADATTIGTSGQHLRTNVSNLYATAAGDEYITNASAVTVAATTTAANGKIDISTTSGTLTVNTVNGHSGMTAHGTGNITLSGENTATNGDGIEIRQNITTTGDISLTGTTDANNRPVNAAYAGVLNAAVVQGNNISLAATANHASADVLGYYGAGGSLMASGTLTATTASNGNGAGFYMWGGTTQSATGMTITGSSNTNVGVKIENTATIANTTSGALSITASSGDFTTGTGNNTITNTGAINLKAGQNASSAGGFNGTYLAVTQNGNATTTLETTGTGNLTAPKIINNGTGNVTVAAGSSIAAGTAAGGNVLTVSGNTITQASTGKTYVYTGSASGTGALANLSADYASLYYNGTSQTLNAAFNSAYSSTIAGGADSQVLFRSATAPAFSLALASTTLHKTYGQTDPTLADVLTAVQTAYSAASMPTTISTTVTGVGGSNTFKLTASEALAALTGNRTAGENVANGPYAYTLSAASLNTTVDPATAPTLTIDKADLTQVAASKTYDGLSTVTAAQMTTIAGVNGQTFTATSGTASISDANVVTANKTLTNLSGLTLTSTNGGVSSNYNLNSNLPVAGANNTVTINLADLTLTGTRVYDGTTTYAGQYLTANGANGQTFSVTGLGDTSNLASSSIQTAQPLLTLTGLTLGTSSNGGITTNYSALSTTNSSVNITAANNGGSGGNTPIIKPPSPVVPDGNSNSGSGGNGDTSSGNPYVVLPNKAQVNDRCNANNLEACLCEDLKHEEIDQLAICYQPRKADNAPAKSLKQKQAAIDFRNKG